MYASTWDYVVDERAKAVQGIEKQQRHHERMWFRHGEARSDVPELLERRVFGRDVLRGVHLWNHRGPSVATCRTMTCVVALVRSGCVLAVVDAMGDAFGDDGNTGGKNRPPPPPPHGAASSWWSAANRQRQRQAAHQYLRHDIVIVVRADFALTVPITLWHPVKAKKNDDRGGNPSILLMSGGHPRNDQNHHQNVSDHPPIVLADVNDRRRGVNNANSSRGGDHLVPSVGGGGNNVTKHSGATQEHDDDQQHHHPRRRTPSTPRRLYIQVGACPSFYHKRWYPSRVQLHHDTMLTNTAVSRVRRARRHHHGQPHHHETTNATTNTDVEMEMEGHGIPPQPSAASRRREGDSGSGLRESAPGGNHLPPLEEGIGLFPGNSTTTNGSRLSRPLVESDSAMIDENAAAAAAPEAVQDEADDASPELDVIMLSDYAVIASPWTAARFLAKAVEWTVGQTEDDTIEREISAEGLLAKVAVATEVRPMVLNLGMVGYSQLSRVPKGRSKSTTSSSYHRGSRPRRQSGAAAYVFLCRPPREGQWGEGARNWGNRGSHQFAPYPVRCAALSSLQYPSCRRRLLLSTQTPFVGNAFVPPSDTVCASVFGASTMIVSVV